MNKKYFALCQEYYDKVGKKIEKGNMTTEEVKKLFDNFMLKVVCDYFEEEEKEKDVICDLELAYRKEVIYWVEEHNNNEDDKIKLNDEEVKEIARLMLDDDQLNIELDNTIQYYIEQKNKNEE